MSSEPFGRQLLPVKVEVTGGEKVDREHWAGRLRSWLNNQPCAVNHTTTKVDTEAFMIYPDANND